MLNWFRTLGLVCSFSMLLAGAASALPTITIDVLDIVGGPQDVTADGTFNTPNPPGQVYFWALDASQAIAEGGGQLNSWTVSAKEDPFVTNNVNLTNTDNVSHIYLASVLLPTGGDAYNSIISSSVGVTITDSNGNNSMLIAEEGGIPMYRGQINGVTELGLPLGPLTTADCQPFPAPGCSATDSNGIAFQAEGPGIANSIAILLRFELSPGDSAGFTSRLEVVPEPLTGTLLSLGLIGLGFVGRRRR